MSSGKKVRDRILGLTVRKEGFMLIPTSLRNVKVMTDGYEGDYQDLHFIVSEAVENDGKLWRHVSLSRFDKSLPTYTDLMVLKNMCIGKNHTALQVFPSEDKHINVAGELAGIEVLHLWSCGEGDVIPDFTRGGNMI